MFRISEIKVEGMKAGCVTDKRPNISFSLESDKKGDSLKEAIIKVGNWQVTTRDQINNEYMGEMMPYTEYFIFIRAYSINGEEAEATASFWTGRMLEPWKGKWITDVSYDFGEKESPRPMNFRHSFSLKGQEVKRAWIYATALGIYELQLNGKKVGEDYFAPGFTAYEHQIQYQTYDITKCLSADNEVMVVVGGGWAVGEFNYSRKNRISADRQAFLCEIHVVYENGEHAVWGTDDGWEVTEEGNYRAANWYDGEIYDATVDVKTAMWRRADVTVPRGKPSILAQYGCPVRKHETLSATYVTTTSDGESIYDFGQNFAGVISAELEGKRGQKLVFRHAEILVGQRLYVKSLRTAKATAEYVCVDGKQTYSPKLTYMGFRYVGVKGIAKEDITLSAYVLHSAYEENGEFSCSNALLNQLQSNIRWGGKSNFVDIPTDCPQRDERLGWTGDIAIFASTACYNFDMGRFLDKWLLDLRSEQGKGGGIPMVVPRAGDQWPPMASSCWGDSCILVPWAEYQARGNKRMLRECYPAMKKFLKAARRWAGLLSVTPDGRYIWKMPFHWGDWCSPEGDATIWIRRGKWIATAYFSNSCRIVSKVAEILGEQRDAVYYKKLSRRISEAYRNVFTDGKGTLKKEFQTAYVLPLHFQMTKAQGGEQEKMIENLVKLIEKADYHLSTGFTGTPYLLFALSDYGRADVAYRLLLQDTCPSWLYAVKNGATTIWERWDALRPDGTVNVSELVGKAKSDNESSGGMVSFNHYANGAVGDWLYKRCLGIEAVKGGYKVFRVRPILGGNLTWAKGKVKTPFGEISVYWKVEQGRFGIEIKVPVSTGCILVMPDGIEHKLVSGEHFFECFLAR